MTTTILSDETKLFSLMHTISKLLRSQIEKKFQPYGFTMPQLSVLKFISDKEITTLTEVAGHVGFSNSTTCGILDRMEKHNIITRERSKQDKRIVILKLSDHGQKLRDDLRLSKKALLAGLLSQIEPDVRKEFIDTMERFSLLLGQAINREASADVQA